MKLMYILDKIKRFPNQDLALYLMIVSIFLPFYLFLSLFLFYFILLIFTGKMKHILRQLLNYPVLLTFIAYRTIISAVSGNLLGVAASILFLWFAIFFVYYQKRINQDFFHIVLQTILLGSIFAALFAFLEHFEIVHKFNYAFLAPNMQVWHQNRAEVTFFNPNYYGIICCFCIMIGFYLFTMTKNWKWKVICIIACFINLFGLNFTQNRTAFPAIICGAIIYLFTTIKSSRAFWLSVGVFIIGLFFLFSNDIGVRMGTLDSSMDERISIWNAGFTLFKQNPLFGEGPLTYMHSYQRIGAIYHEHAHSIYIDTILSYGYIGTLLLAIASIKPVRSLIEMSRQPQKRPIVGLYVSFLVVVAVHGIFDLALFWIQSAFIFLVVMCSIPMWERNETIDIPHE